MGKVITQHWEVYNYEGVKNNKPARGELVLIGNPEMDVEGVEISIGLVIGDGVSTIADLWAKFGGNSFTNLRNHIQEYVVHGATATPTPNRIAMYGPEKGLKSDKVPNQANDVIRKTEMDAEAQARQDADADLSADLTAAMDAEAQARQQADTNHANLSTAHGSTPTPTAIRIAMYGPEKGLKSGKVPSQANDVIRKTEMDAEAQARETLQKKLVDEIGALRLLGTLDGQCLGTFSGRYFRTW